MIPPLTDLQRKFPMILNKLCPVLFLFFLMAVISIASAQEADEGSAVAAEAVQVDAAVSGDMPVAGQPAGESVEANIEKEMETKIGRAHV
jgi:hypothetical protein